MNLASLQLINEPEWLVFQNGISRNIKYSTKPGFLKSSHILAIENDTSKTPVRPYTNCTGQIWYVHWFPSWKVCFGPNSIAVQSWEVCALEIEFFQWRSCVSCREFFKVTCAAVHELYRSNLVWPLIPILKGVFWSKQHSFTVLGSMCTGNWIFSMEILC